MVIRDPHHFRRFSRIVQYKTAVAKFERFCAEPIECLNVTKCTVTDRHHVVQRPKAKVEHDVEVVA